MLIAHIALVPEYAVFDTRLLMRVAGAIQKQVMRDLRPIWGAIATVDAFESLEDVPVGYWPVIVTNRDLGGQDGTHLEDTGSPYSLVEARPGWSLTASHECLEMIVDPFGNRTIAAASPRDDQHRAEFLVEICDPCQDARTAYTVNDVLVSDFVTPEYFEPVSSSRARYTHSGALDKPRDLLPGGYVSWRDPLTRRWWQRARDEGGVQDVDLGLLDGADRGQRSLREIINTRTQHHARISRGAAPAMRRIHESDGARKRTGRGRAASLRTHVRALPPVAPRGVAGSREIGAQIEAALRALADAKRAGKELPDVDRVLTTLSAAKEQLQMVEAEWTKRGLAVPARLLPEGGELAQVMSALHTPLVAPHGNLLFGRDIVGFSKYEDLDLRWVATVWNHLFRSVVPFSVASPPSVVVHPLQSKSTIAIAGDWGTGDPSSLAIAKRIDDASPTYTVHLGDVYYSGTEGEETENLLAHWPAGTIASFTLNSNHEMYSGGNGYFHVALADEKFETQGEYSYFALANDDWVVLGLDSAYAATGFYQDGALNDVQVAWIKALVAADTFRGPNGRKKVVVLTHHQPIDIDGKKNDALWNAVIDALGSAPDYWYWGHVHAVAAFKPIRVGGADMRGRLVGHGGVPYRSDGQTALLDWTEPKDADLIDDQGTSRSRNGYAMLTFDGPRLVEELVDELGNCRWKQTLG